MPTEVTRVAARPEEIDTDPPTRGWRWRGR